MFLKVMGMVPELVRILWRRRKDWDVTEKDNGGYYGAGES